MKTVNQADVIKFIKEDIIHRFSISKTIIANRGMVFTGKAIETFIKEYEIKLTHLTPYFAQANSQAEATNKVLKGILEKMVDENPRNWHNLLYETLRAYWTSKRSGNKIKELDEVILAALDHRQIHKKAVARAYNKRMRFKNVNEGDSVWKVILPISSKDPKYGKWSFT
ncbi:uncharacterized protein LOC132800141 [Ziziphus jujuba]|uniref:Uncharacterized protein LOC132800141 n=1 Tax=Ziziphus jujuba TaxID=326968 RepID=A0ABM3ZXB7_ZIZJJ|nr:uncharacterized protein LOC132800141 [Ziziphus jujuba]